MANQVLLATMWYVTSCWIFSSSCISQIQRLIRNFLWSGKNGDATRAKIAWPVITLPTSHGAWGLWILLVRAVRSLASLWYVACCQAPSPGRSSFFVDFRDAHQSLAGLGSLTSDGFLQRCVVLAFHGELRTDLHAVF